MKYSIIFIIVIFVQTKCVVTKNVENIVDEFLEEREKHDMKTNSSFQTKKSGHRESVYLEDVLYAVKNQNWTDDEQPCLNNTLFLLKSLQNFTLWAVWDWDSVSSEPQGLLFGNRYQLGNFDECMSPPWRDTHVELRTQYCLADIVLENPGNTVKKHTTVQQFDPYQSALGFIEYRPSHSRPLNELTWGICVPATCTPRSVERLLRIALSRSHVGVAGLKPSISITERCQVAGEVQEYDTLFYSFVVIAVLLVISALVCTYLNCRTIPTSSNSTKHELIKAFCLKENSQDLLRMKKNGLESLYGMRFFTICFIVMDHQIGIFNSGPVSDGRKVDQDAKSLAGMLVLHDDLFVDTFFFLSGFLTATTLVNFHRFPNPLLIILKRYIRLVIALAVVIFYLSAVYPYTGSGPLWTRAFDYESGPCLRNWWLNILMVNNYINNEDICITISWYIPCDFHFFTITVVVYYLYRKFPGRFIIYCAILIVVAAVLAPGVINFVYGLPAVQLFTYEFITDVRGSRQFHLTYIKSHTRFGAHLVGVGTGFIFTYYKEKGYIHKLSKKLSIFGVIIGSLVMLTVMVTGTIFLWHSYDPVVGALYAALDRPVWACAVAMILLSCSLGNVPLLNGFLSWFPWVPLSRLSYGLYLTHTVFIGRNMLVARNPQHNDHMEICGHQCCALPEVCAARWEVGRTLPPRALTAH